MPINFSKIKGDTFGRLTMLVLVASIAPIGATQFGLDLKLDRSMAQVSPLKPEPFVGKPIYAPNVVLVTFRPGTTAFQRREVILRYGLQIDPNFKSPYLMRLLIPAGSLLSRSFEPVEAAVQLLGFDRSVRSANPDMQIKPDQSLPNDTRFGEQWGLHNTGQTSGSPDADMDAPEAWNATPVGPKVIVGLIDDGVDWNHPDLLGNVWVNTDEVPNNGIDDDSNGFIDDRNGWDFVSNDKDPTPTSGNEHGTHTAGTVAAVMNNGLGVAGTARDVQLMPIRMYNGQSTWMSTLVQSIDYCWQNGAKVISVSYNIDGYTQDLVDAILRARAADCVYANSAGNNAQLNPPRGAIRDVADNVVFVAASTHNDTLASFSNYGVKIEIAAPGENILSTRPGGLYQLMSGTSMATPHAAGGIAQIRSVYPGLTARQALDRAINTADIVSAISSNISGGRMNLSASLDNDSIPPSDPTSFTFIKKSSQAAMISFLGSGDDGVNGQASGYEIRVSKNPLTPANFNAATLLPVATPQVNHGQLIQTVLDGLQSGTGYYVGIRAKDNVGNVSTNILFGQVATVPTTILDNADGLTEFAPVTGPWGYSNSSPFNGANSWADSPVGSYGNNINIELKTTRPIPVKAYMSLKFALKYDLESNYDYLNLEASLDGVTWNRLARYNGTSPGWTTQSVSLVAYYRRFVWLRFTMTSDGSVVKDGVYIDDVALSEGVRVMADNMEGAVNFTSSDGFTLTTARANSPTRSWTDSASGNYVNNANNNMLGTVTYDLSNVASPVMTFMAYLNTENGYDYLRAMASTDGGATYSERGKWSGETNAWGGYSAPLPSGLVKIGFKFTSDGSVVRDGVWIDDVAIFGEPWYPAP